MTSVSLEQGRSSRPSTFTPVWEIGLRAFETSSPDLIVHGVLDPGRSMNDIRADLKSIMSRLVRLLPPIRISIDG